MNIYIIDIWTYCIDNDLFDNEIIKAFQCTNKLIYNNIYFKSIKIYSIGNENYLEDKIYLKRVCSLNISGNINISNKSLQHFPNLKILKLWNWR